MSALRGRSRHAWPAGLRCGVDALPYVADHGRMNAIWIKSSLSFSNWRKPKRSFSHGNCVEVANLPGVIGVRDSKDPGGTVLTFPAPAWRAFTAAAKGARVAH